MKNSILHTSNLAVGYNNKILIEDININVSCGQIITLIGPNGAGKSTILKTIVHQLDAICGTVYIENKPLSKLNRNALARTMSIVMTESISPELMTCKEIIESGRYPYTGQSGILSENDKSEVLSAMQLTDTTAIADKYFNQISDGQRQRVMLARAICQQPQVLILDEPTSFLDIHHKIQLINILKQLVREKNLAVIMSMHEIDFAQRVSDWVVCIKGNKIDRQGLSEEIFTNEYISKLYNLSENSYNSLFGTVELDAPQGEAEVFVIAGNSIEDIKTFRQLQRKGIPFAVGVLHENDISFSVAKALAGNNVIAERAYEPISQKQLDFALEALNKCKYVICNSTCFGTINMGNNKLLENAKNNGKLIVSHK